MEETIVDVSGLARVLGVSEWTIRHRAESGDSPGFRIGNRWRFSVERVIDELHKPKAVPIISERSKRALGWAG